MDFSWSWEVQSSMVHDRTKAIYMLQLWPLGNGTGKRFIHGCRDIVSLPASLSREVRVQGQLHNSVPSAGRDQCRSKDSAAEQVFADTGLQPIYRDSRGSLFCKERLREFN